MEECNTTVINRGDHFIHQIRHTPINDTGYFIVNFKFFKLSYYYYFIIYYV